MASSRTVSVAFMRDKPGRNSAVGRTAGVTLIEMVVVVAIIGLISAISLPSISAGLDSVRLASASESISAFLNSAVTRAERRQLPVAVIISPKENRLVQYSNEPGFKRELTLPSGVKLEAVLPKVDESEDAQQGRRVLFLPGASVPGVGVQIANEHGSRRIIRLDPMTGFPRVESVGSNTSEQ